MNPAAPVTNIRFGPIVALMGRGVKVGGVGAPGNSIMRLLNH